MESWHPAAAEFGTLDNGDPVSLDSDLEVRAAVGRGADLVRARLNRAGRRWWHRDGGVTGRGLVAVVAWQHRDYLNWARSGPAMFQTDAPSAVWLVAVDLELMVLSALGLLAFEQTPPGTYTELFAPGGIVAAETETPGSRFDPGGPERAPTSTDALVVTLVAAPAAPPPLLLCH
jgi:hypothetical protein